MAIVSRQGSGWKSQNQLGWKRPPRSSSSTSDWWPTCQQDRGTYATCSHFSNTSRDVTPVSMFNKLLWRNSSWHRTWTSSGIAWGLVLLPCHRLSRRRDQIPPGTDSTQVGCRESSAFSPGRTTPAPSATPHVRRPLDPSPAQLSFSGHSPALQCLSPSLGHRTGHSSQLVQSHQCWLTEIIRSQNYQNIAPRNHSRKL